jgi:hypothetical protein
MKHAFAVLLFLAALPVFAQQPLALKATTQLIPQVGGGTAHGINLTWPAPTSGGTVTGYNVKRSAVTGGPYTTVGTTTGTLAYSDVSAPLQTEGATFFYVVSATGPGGESPNSLETSATIPFSAPGQPGKPSAVSH